MTEADVRIHGTIGVRPIDRFQQEKLSTLLTFLPIASRAPIRRQVPNDARVCFKTNRYSVPWRFIGRQVEVRVEGDEVSLLHGGREIARHDLLPGRFQESIDPAHFRGLFRMIVGEEPSKPPHDPRFPVEDVMVRDLGAVRPGRRHRRCGMSHLDALEQELRELKLTRLADQLQSFLADAAKQEWDYGTFLGNCREGRTGGPP